MDDKVAKVPAIRFAGFTGDWELKKLGEIAKDISDGDWIEKEHIFDNGEYRIIQTGNLGEGEYLDKPNNAKYFRQKDFDEIKANEIFSGDLLISRLADPAGRTIILPETNHKMVTAVDVTIIRPDESFDNVFLMTQMNTFQNLSEVGKSVSGTSHKRISRKNLEKINLLIPNISEQKRVGLFFKHIDHLITLHQRKYDLLLKLKKGLLQKMFVSGDEKVPEIRFRGFTDDWHKRVLRDVAEYRRGSFPQPYGNKKWYGGEGAMPFVQVVDVTARLGLVKNTKQKISKLAQPMSVFVPKGKVIVTLQGSIGRVAITDYDVFVDRTLLIFEKYKVQVDEHFWAYIIQILFGIEKRKAPGGTIKTITKEALSSFEISYPKYAEQEKIGDFFANLDSLITGSQCEIDTLKKMKQSLLQKMFV